MSDTEVQIGNVATISGPAPGLGQTIVNGTKAYVAHVNSTGGVCGRKLKLVTGDDRLDTGANRSETARLKDQVFAFVGSWSVVGDGGATVLDGTNVPDVTLAISDRLAQAAKQQNYHPKVPFWGAQAHGQKFLQQAGDAADGSIVGVAYSVPEDAAQTPAVGTMAQWYARANPGAELDFFSIMGWAGTDMFVKALTASGPQPTRDKVLATLRGYHDCDADGVIAPHTDPAAKNPEPCFAVLDVEGGKWKRIAPASGFTC